MGTTINRSRRLLTVTLVAVSAGIVGCRETIPTSLDDAQLPGEPLTLEIELDWNQFGSGLEVFGGYGKPQELGAGIIAESYAGTLSARTLVRFAQYPTKASVVDATGTTREDDDLTYIGGRVMAWFDSDASTNTGPVDLVLGAVQQEWDGGTVNWSSAVDSVGGDIPWVEVGGGPVSVVDTATWDPAEGDTISFLVDSAQIAAWGDSSDKTRGARIELVTPGERLFMHAAFLHVTTRSSINPDTVLILTTPADQATFVYDHVSQPPANGVRVGGTPSWRTVLDLTMPDELTGPPELCAAAGCPFVISPQDVSFAGLSLRSRVTEDAAFQPSDSMRLDVRAVLSRDALPKSPLGESLIQNPFGTVIPGDFFGLQDGQLVEVPITSFVRDLLSEPEVSGRDRPNTLALISKAEPSSFAFASFHGHGSTMEPMLKLILTVIRTMEVP
ncbi:MAG: hypothetical protein MK239_04615 [Gemmatimonadetes bacterium]|nr:hypothetical protein [Gemmatimonadota bacterium]